MTLLYVTSYSAHHVLEMDEHAGDHRARKAMRVEQEPDDDLLAWNYHQRQRVICAFDVPRTGDVQATGPLFERSIEGVVFKDHEAFKQRYSAWQLTPTLHLGQRTIDVLRSLNLLVLKSLQPRQHTFICDLHSRRKSVYE